MRRKNLVSKVLAVALSASMTLGSFSSVSASDTIGTDIATYDSEQQSDVLETPTESEITVDDSSQITVDTSSDENQNTTDDGFTDLDDSDNNAGEVIPTQEPQDPTEVVEPTITEDPNSSIDITPTPELEEDPINELEYTSGSFKVKVKRKDGQDFPSGTYLNLYTLDDMLSDEVEFDQLKQAYLDALIGEAASKYADKYIETHPEIEWTDTLKDNLDKDYMNFFKSFDIFQFDIFNKDNSLYDTEGVGFNISFEVTDQTMLSSLKDGSEWVDLITYDEHFEATLLKEDVLSVGGDDETGLVVASADVDKLAAFYAFTRTDLNWEFNTDDYGKLLVKVGDTDVICTCNLSSNNSGISDEDKQNPWKHDWGCAIFKAQVEESCTCEHKGEDIDVLYHPWECASLIEAIKNKCTCEHGYREEDLDFYVSLHSDDCEISKHYYSTPIASYASTNKPWANEGTKLKGNVGDVKEGYLLTDDFYDFTGSGYYSHIRWYSGETKLSGWISDGTNVKMKETNSYLVFVTNSTSAGGKFGYNLTHIAINNGRWVNAKITVTNVAAKMYAYNDTRSVKYYPVVGILKWNGGGGKIQFKSSGARLGLKFDLYYDDGSSATGNYAMSLAGVNAGQNFGLSAAGLAHKYSLYNNVVYAKTCKPFSLDPNEVICAVQASNDGDGDGAPYYACKNGQTYYQYNNISSFKYAIGCAGNPLDSSEQGRRASYSHLTEAAAKEISLFNDPSKIDDSYMGSRITSWLNGYAWGASDPTVEKYVSATKYDISSKSMNLSTPGQTFYYNFKVGVQGIPSTSYAFTKFNLQDAIPAGVTYNGFSVKDIATGNDVTGYFTATNSAGMITISATSAALGTTDFYDSTYIISLQCNGNPEKVPTNSISYSGDSYSYSIYNAAFLNAEFKNSSGGAGVSKSYDSGVATISYSGTKKRITAEKYIWDEENNGAWIKSKDLTKSGDITYLISVSVPSNDYMASLNTFTFEDTLPAGVTYKGNGVTVYGNWPDDASSKFNITATSNKITITAKPEHLNTYAFHGKTYLVMFKCKVDTTAVNPNRVSGNTYYYTFSNNATITTKHKGDGSNTVTTTNSVPVNVTATRTNPSAPVKYIMDGNTKASSKTTKDITEIYTYRIEQSIPNYDPIWYISTMSMTDTLESCFDFVDIGVYFNDTLYTTLSKTKTSYGGVTLSLSGQTVTVNVTNGFNPERYGGNINYVMRVKIRDGVDLSRWISQNMMGKVVIPNTASTTFTWGKGNPLSVTNTSNSVRLIVEEVKERVEVTKLSSDTKEVIPDATFKIYEWNGTSYVNYCGMTYNSTKKVYESDKDLVKSATNNGKFRVKETEVPDGYTGSFTKDFTLTATPGTLKTESFTAYNDIKKGGITIYKSGWDGNSSEMLEDTEFIVLANDTIKSPEGKTLMSYGETLNNTSYFTDEDGTIDINGVYPGKYRIIEKGITPGYTMSTPNFYDVTVTAGNWVEYEFDNDIQKVTIKKVSEKLSGDTSNTPLKGVKFRIWCTDSDYGGWDYDVISTTNDSGEIVIKELYPGDYSYQEVSTPDGYAIDNTIRTFTIDDKGLIDGVNGKVLTVENKVIKADFAKVDKATGSAVSGATLELRDSNGKVVETWVSGTTPHRINRIKAGTYTLVETKAPTGYKKAYPVTCTIVNTKSSVQTFTMTDTKYVTIDLTKVIHQNEIVLSHGTPTFIFKLEGTDLDGDKHTYYQEVDFTGVGETTNAVDVNQRARFTVPAGTYTATEVPVSRYALENLYSSGSGNCSVSGSSATFTLTKNQNGGATFVNKKTKDGGTSDNNLVVNNVVKK